ncbi:hypothetical protein NMG60_11034497 [Bertholletia excelsa]
MGSSSGSDVEAGFAKLQGEDFEYYMQTYSIVLGRNSKKSTVDVDLSSLGGGMNISRHHARIFYDFPRRRFALEVLGKNGCSVEGVLHLPGHPPVKLDSQDHLQIGDKEFYFLLPVRSILGGPIGPRHHVNYHHSPAAAAPHYPNFGGEEGRKGQGLGGGEYFENDYDDGEGRTGKKTRRGGKGHEVYGYSSAIAAGRGGMLGQSVLVTLPADKKAEARSRVDRESDNHQLLQLEEKDVVSSVATVLSDICGPGEWMPVEKLHTELVDLYSNVWHHSRVRRYLTSDDYLDPESHGKPWYGLLVLLRKYPEHFVINTRSKGRVAVELVSLVSLLS